MKLILFKPLGILLTTLLLSLAVLGELTADKIGLSFPPVKDRKQIQFTQSHIKALNVNRIRFAEKWSYREPKKGKFNWKALDERITFISDNNLSLLLTIEAVAPNWACSKHNRRGCLFSNESDFRNFIRSLLQRYSNKISKIQFGNEWDIVGNYPGSIKDFVRFSNILFEETRQHSPATAVVLGGITKQYPICILSEKTEPALSFSKLTLKDKEGLNERLRKLLYQRDIIIQTVDYVFEHAKYDIIDIHLYDDFENWGKYLDVLTHKTKKSLIVSEFGGPHPKFEVYSQKYQARQISSYLEVIKQLPVTEAYYFKLVDTDNCWHTSSGLIDKKLNRKEVYDIFKSR
ncbi:hypothetical protein BVY04_01695 [bacterium M21]|nr:hypothetical protein BVY04_01695 [bacterium M21]